MIVVKLSGGLGNQMFQYAAGRSLSLRIGSELRLDISELKNDPIRSYGLSRFSIQENFVSDRELRLVKKPSHHLRNFLVDVRCRLAGGFALCSEREPGTGFDPGFFSLPDNRYLDGYWQSENYFLPVQEIIRQEFTVGTEPDPDNRNMAARISSSDAVALHIRRGDYVTDPKTNRDHGTCSMKYYASAMETITDKVKNPLFFIFTDDPVWVRKNFTPAGNHLLVSINDPGNSAEDLRLMTLCRHHIIANSSFSWWGAWLCRNPGKIVCAPELWFSSLKKDTRDLIPPGWIRL
jgi:hypothetical protein